MSCLRERKRFGSEMQKLARMRPLISDRGGLELVSVVLVDSPEAWGGGANTGDQIWLCGSSNVNSAAHIYNCTQTPPHTLDGNSDWILMGVIHSVWGGVGRGSTAVGAT